MPLYSTKPALTYDDINLVPSFSEIESRSQIDLTTQLTTNYKLRIPIIASPMDTVCESEMAIALAELGGVGCIHRFMSIEEQVREVNKTIEGILHEKCKLASNMDILWSGRHIPIMAAVGANGDFAERAKELVNAGGANIILIDVAHGDHSFVKHALIKLKTILPSYVDVIAGNIATKKSAMHLQDWGADALRVGIGGGSLCTTRIKTGFGIPNITSLEEVNEVASVPVIACGGIKNSGDIAKALAVGADSVILGSLLAGTKEAPGAIIEKPSGLYKQYRGSASLETKITHGQTSRNVEGESTIISFKGGAKFIINGLTDGIKSALSYAGALNLKEFNPDYVVVTNSGRSEAKPHLLG